MMSDHPAQQTGFTLLEVLIVGVVIGILAAIVAPSWLGFWANRRVSDARDQIRQGIQQAQRQAIATRTSWQFSLRQADQHLEWAVHPQSVGWATVNTWQPLDSSVVLDESNTLTEEVNDIRYVAFNFRGEEKARSIVTLEGQNGRANKKCVFLATLLGKTANGEEQPHPSNRGFYCY